VEEHFGAITLFAALCDCSNVQQNFCFQLQQQQQQQQSFLISFNFSLGTTQTCTNNGFDSEQNGKVNICIYQKFQ